MNYVNLLVLILRLINQSMSNHKSKLQLIYVISNPLHASQDLYKIGRHTGGSKELLNRYNTGLPNAVIYFSHPVTRDGKRCSDG